MVKTIGAVHRGSATEGLLSAVVTWIKAFVARLPLVTGRPPAGALAMLGVLCWLPTTVWPVLRFTFPMHAENAFGSAYRGPDVVTESWSWGRSVTQTGNVDAGLEQANAVTLAIIVIGLVAGVLGALCWLLVRGQPGVLLGAVGTTFALAVCAGSVGERYGYLWSQWWSDPTPTSAVIETTTVGHGEVAAVIALSAALVSCLWQPLSSLVGPRWGAAVGSAPIPAPQGAGRGRALEGPPVEFSDDIDAGRIGTRRR